MNAQEIIEYIRTSEKKTPVKVYVWEKTPVDFPGCQVFSAAPGQKIVFGDWKDVKPVLEANDFAHIEIENNCRNSAIPMLDLKDIPARIEPGAVIREQVQIGKNAVIMMGAIINIGAVIGEVEIVGEYWCVTNAITPDDISSGCVDAEYLLAYANGEVMLAANFAENGIRYKEPRPLSDFYTVKKCRACKSGYEASACKYDEKCLVSVPLTRAPQSWCYAEGL